MSVLRRLASFASLPSSSPVSCVRLANCGFIYAGQSDILVCQHCGDEFRGWLATHRNPSTEHRCPNTTARPTTDDLALLRQVIQDHCDTSHSTIHAICHSILQRAARSGLLGPSESRDITPRDLDRSSQASAPRPDTCRDTVGDRVIPSSDSGVRRLRLSLSRRHGPTCTPMVQYCPSCASWWWWRYMPDSD